MVTAREMEHSLHASEVANLRIDEQISVTRHNVVSGTQQLFSILPRYAEIHCQARWSTSATEMEIFPFDTPSHWSIDGRTETYKEREVVDFPLKKVWLGGW
jgi:hypothetical protein